MRQIQENERPNPRFSRKRQEQFYESDSEESSSEEEFNSSNSDENCCDESDQDQNRATDQGIEDINLEAFFNLQLDCYYSPVQSCIKPTSIQVRSGKMDDLHSREKNLDQIQLQTQRKLAIMKDLNQETNIIVPNKN
uniref:Uncharacterized protein n=1 Tax=Nelumbo nucifera TaxID=4432 RepID=A0A822YEK1_NELNU|nr:TPA_asm: hypothetical protein HUJ06_029406 [Nelumbo nucifera]